MTIIRTIICNTCGKQQMETKFNIGFPGWGHIAGLMNPDTGEDTAHLCPDCMIKIKEKLNDLG